jgi:ethanolamine transporter EutH
MNRFELAQIGNGGNELTASLAMWRALFDQFALTILGAGLAMGGGLTAWLCVDLVLLGKLPRRWMAPGAVAGILALPSPLLLPESRPLMIALAAYCLWCLVLAIRTSLPAAYPDYS